MASHVAYCGYPHDNGVFSFYRALRAALAPYGIQVHCVSVGDAERGRWDASFVDEGCVALPAGSNPKAAARAFVEWCQMNDIGVVMPQHSPIVLASLRHMPAEIRVVHACMDLFPEALAFYREIAGGCDRMVAATPRQIWELERRKVSDAALRLIPFAVRTDDFSAPPAELRPGHPLRLTWVARMNHLQKGVAWVPETLRRLDELAVAWTLDVVGQGSHAGWLQQQLRHQVNRGKVRFHGRLVHRQIAEILAQSHGYFLPTRYEGFGISIIEAMAAGCAPVVSHLPGVTDYIIEPGRSGLLAKLGSTTEYAAALARLYHEPGTLKSLRTGARARALELFSLAPFGRAYAELLSELPQRSARTTLPWSQFEPRTTTYRRVWLHRVLPGRLTRRALDARERLLAASMPGGLEKHMRR